MVKILSSNKLESGKKIGSRIIRKSLITNSMSKDLSHSERYNMARTMNHSLDTQERYYNRNNVTDSVVKHITNSSQPSTSRSAPLPDPSTPQRPSSSTSSLLESPIAPPWSPITPQKNLKNTPETVSYTHLTLPTNREV